MKRTITVLQFAQSGMIWILEFKVNSLDIPENSTSMNQPLMTHASEWYLIVVQHRYICCYTVGGDPCLQQQSHGTAVQVALEHAQVLLT